MALRAGFSVLVLFVAFVPMLAAWALMLVVMPSVESPTMPTATPNPAQPPAGMLGPLDMLVYANPWFHGTLAFWLFPWMVIFLVYAIVMTVVARPPPEQSARPFRRAFVVVGISFLLGVVFAVPWFYGAYCFLAER